jgi:hypothetical protein
MASTESWGKRARFLPYLVSFLVPFLLYLNTIPHDFALDDYVAITENSLVQKGMSGIPSLLTHGYFFGQNGRNDESYRPFSLVLFTVEKQVAGGSPHVHHFFNVLLYALGCLLFFAVLQGALPEERSHLALPIALLFAAHPIHTEVVANIKSRDEILSLLFGMLTLLLVQRSCHKQGHGSLVPALLAYALALLSKESALALVAVIPMFLPFTSPLRTRTVIVRSTPFFLLAAAYLLLRALVLDSGTFQKDLTVFANSLLGAKTTAEFFATNFFIHGKYLLLLLFPHPLSWDYSYNQIPIVRISDARALLAMLTFALLVIAATRGLRRRSWASFGILFYFIALSPASNFFVTIGTTMAERFLFIPSAGFCIFVAFTADALLERAPRPALGKSVGAGPGSRPRRVCGQDRGTKPGLAGRLDDLPRRRRRKPEQRPRAYGFRRRLSHPTPRRGGPRSPS